MTIYYFAGAEEAMVAGSLMSKIVMQLLKKNEIERVLYNYYYMGHLPKFLDHFKYNFLDSGAFSAHNSGMKIDFEEYINFCKIHKDKLTVYSNLDVIGDAEATMKNQLRMESQGLKPLPCFHIGEDWKYLKEYCKRYDYVALGGMVPYSMKVKELINFLKRAFSIIPKETKVHGFGLSNTMLIKAFPFYSIDSSSWSSGERFGSLYIARRKMTAVSINKGMHRGIKQYLTITDWNIQQWKKFADNLEERGWNTKS